MRIGVLGGGQLARMLAEAGIPAGLDFSFLDPKPDACAGSLGELITADWNDPGALDRLAVCDRVTCDFENVPAASLEHLAQSVPVRPEASALAVAQDRLSEKRIFEELDIPVPAFAPVSSRTELAAAVDLTGFPAILKTRRLGYDGKGQALLRDAEDMEPAWRELGDHALILESRVDFQMECAITAVRSAAGEVRCYPLSRTLHRDGILKLALAPVPGGEALQADAERLVTRLLERLDYVGVLSLELFLTEDGWLANEFAPRVHNSAHWTIEGTICSQFENHLRAVCDWPLGETAARGAALMVNWIGELPDPGPMLAVPGLAWHDYRKTPRPGRKVGHATVIAADHAQLERRLERLGPLLDEHLAALLPVICRVRGPV